MPYKGPIRDDVPQLEMNNCARCGKDFHAYICNNAKAKICHACRQTPERRKLYQTRRTREQLLGKPLTVRNYQVLDCLVEGLLNKEIAFKLKLDTGTIKAYVSEVLGKTGHANRTSAAIWWDRNRDKVNKTPMQ